MNNSNFTFQYISHTADIEILVKASTLINLFEGALSALMNYIGIPDTLSDSKEYPFSFPAFQSIEEHFVEFLNEALFVSITTKKLVTGVNWNFFLQNSSKGNFILTPWKTFLKEVKAVTYYNISVFHNGIEWEANFVIDV